MHPDDRPKHFKKAFFGGNSEKDFKRLVSIYFPDALVSPIGDGNGGQIAQVGDITVGQFQNGEGEILFDPSGRDSRMTTNEDNIRGFVRDTIDEIVVEHFDQQHELSKVKDILTGEDSDSFYSNLENGNTEEAHKTLRKMYSRIIHYFTKYRYAKGTEIQGRKPASEFSL